MKNKKAQVENVGAIIALVSGIGVTLLVLIFISTFGGSLYDTVEDDIDNVGLTGVNDAQFTSNNGSAVSIGNTNIVNNSVTQLQLEVANGSSVNNYFTVDFTAGTATLFENSLNNTAINATYSYRASNSIQNNIKTSITSGFEALEKTGNYTPLIVVAIVITLVLIIVMGMGIAKRQGNGGAL